MALQLFGRRQAGQRISILCLCWYDLICFFPHIFICHIFSYVFMYIFIYFHKLLHWHFWSLLKTSSRNEIFNGTRTDTHTHITIYYTLAVWKDLGMPLYHISTWFVWIMFSCVFPWIVFPPWAKMTRICLCWHFRFIAPVATCCYQATARDGLCHSFPQETAEVLAKTQWTGIT